MQKGTIGILLSGADMPFTKEGMRPDIIMNPNAIPSRMTIGQLVEAMTGKIAANKGSEVDGTPFEPHDVETLKTELKKLGYNDDGEEYGFPDMSLYKIIIPIEEPEEETIEQAAKRELEYIHETARGFDFDLGFKTGMVIGAEWQAKRMYSEEEIERAFYEGVKSKVTFNEWFNQFKKQKS